MVCSLGAVDPNTVIKVVKEVTAEEKKRQELIAARPSLDEIVNLHDFEVSTWLLQDSVHVIVCLIGCRKSHPPR